MRKRCSWIHNHANWTPAEEDFLRASRGTMSAKQMAAALPGRTEEAVQSRCTQLRIFKRDMRPPSPPLPPRSPRYWWTGPEIKILRAHVHIQPHLIQRWYLPHRTIHAIAGRSRSSASGRSNSASYRW